MRARGPVSGPVVGVLGVLLATTVLVLVTTSVVTVAVVFCTGTHSCSCNSTPSYSSIPHLCVNLMHGIIHKSLFTVQ